jgi:hypothetical protein
MGELRLDVNKIGSSARDTPMSPDLLGREHHRNELVSPRNAQIGSLVLEICSSGSGRIEGVR